MHLKNITLSNFRCFESITLALHPRLTVLIAPNGAGKTALLDAARIALWPFVKGFDLGSQTGKSASIQINDVRLMRQENNNMEPQLPGTIQACGIWDEDAEVAREDWTQSRTTIKPGTNTKGDEATRRLTAHAAQLQTRVRANAGNVTLPLVAYLGTGRLWYEGRYTSIAADKALDMSSHSRLSGYLNCLTISSSFKQFSDWYGWVYRCYHEEVILAQEQERTVSETGSRYGQMILAVKAAVNCLIQQQTGWRDIAYSVSYQQQLVLTHPEQGVLPLDMLSDGLRNMVAMVADLAFRACKLNPQLGAQAITQTPGIVLIDEVDMFLHPSWQQTVLASLQEAFPKVQFIVTTHSPQVLSTVRRENIRIIKPVEGGYVAAMPDMSPLAREAGDALAYVMDVHTLPPMPEILETVHAYEHLVRQNQITSPEALALKAKLDECGYQIPAADLDFWTFLGQQHG